MIQAVQVSETPSSARDFDPTEDQGLRTAWAVAWLREYQCHTRYLSLLDLEEADEVRVRSAWLDWWDATCVCREALRRLEE